MNARTGPRVLLFCSRLPTRIRGGLDLRVRHQVLALVRRGPTAVFGLVGDGVPISKDICLWRSGDADSLASSFNPFQAITGAMRGEAPPYAHLYSEDVADRLTVAIADFGADVVIISRMDLMPYLDTVLRSGVRRVILDLDETSSHANATISPIMTSRPHSLFFRRWADLVREYEREMVERVGEVWVCSELEVAHVEELYPGLRRATYVQNAIDVSQYRTVDSTRSKQTMLFAGRFDYEPNIDAVRFITAHLIDLLPGFRVQLVGAAPMDWMRTLDDPRVEVVGPVPEMQPYLASAGMAVIPLRAGGGTRLKAIEAMAAGLPVVSTSLGVEGLDMDEGEHYLRAETPEEFAEACLALANDAELHRSLSESGERFASEHFSLDALEQTITAALR